MEILLLMAEGKSNQEIADELFISLKTVKTHVSNILSKLQVQDRTQAVIYAFKHSLTNKVSGTTKGQNGIKCLFVVSDTSFCEKIH